MEKYIINREIGSGSFGKVFIVETKTTGIQYVVKQIDLSKMNKRQRTSAEKEIQVLSKLKHPNIVRYKEAFSNEQHLHIFMELCETGDLHEKIQTKRNENIQFTEEQVMEYFVQLSLALEYIHQQKIIHRDVKTKNVFLTKGNVVKLGDFGVAKILENSFELAQTCIGSPFYVSPEICENRPYDKKCDVWGLGCVLFELTTLRYAFTANNMKSLMTKITTAEHNPLPANTPKGIRTLLGKLLRVNPKQRPTVSDILLTPYVNEVRQKLSGRYCRRFLNNQRSFSEDRTKSSECLTPKNKLKRQTLSISRSSVNLNSNENKLTDPQAKYRGKIPLYKTTSQRSKPGNDVMKMNNQSVKKKLLKQSDCNYLKLIEENKMSNGKCNVIRNHFENSISFEANIDKTVKVFEEDNELSDDIFDNQGGTCLHRPSEGIFEIANPVIRKRWQTDTTKRNQLLSELNELKTATIDSPNIIAARTNLSVDELLMMGTTDMSHIPVLTPLIVQEDSDADPDFISFGSSTHEIDDKTFIVMKGNPMNEMEMRRLRLEMLLGRDRLEKVFDKLERDLNIDQS